jgi:hydrogenase nickel incorporation protein HypA/HybF
MSIAQSIQVIVLEEAEKGGLTAVAEVRLRVGALSGVVPDSLAFCWKLLTEAGPLGGARLAIEAVPVRAKCLKCGTEFEAADFVFVCPGCGAAETEITAGRELTVSHIAGE